MANSLNRFIEAQENTFADALEEIRTGRKKSHWMWYIFPQLAGLGYSEMARFYAIYDLDEAERFLQDPVLGERLIRISKVLAENKGKTAHEIFGSPDDIKLKSSMTLFSMVPNADPVFQQNLDEYFEGKKDEKTLSLL
jgi:uncharacterized protein (DUF1810 family)